MIKYICPGYIALATWTGVEYSNRVYCDLWAEWSTVGRGSIRCVILPTKDTDLGELWRCEFEIDRKGPADHWLYITMFSESGQPINRYTDAGTVFQPRYRERINVTLGAR